MAERKRPADSEPQREKARQRTGPHMDPASVGDRFPTEAGGHPVPDIGEHPVGSAHTGVTDRARPAPDDPGAGDTEQTRAERGVPRR